VVKQTAAAGGRNGAYGLRPLGGKQSAKLADFDRATGVQHTITIKRYLDPEAASRTLWHELAHAAQAEAAIRSLLAAGATPRQLHDRWSEVRERVNGRIPYRIKPWEIDARSHEDRAITHPLTRTP
jgi:hypothetical protein